MSGKVSSMRSRILTVGIVSSACETLILSIVFVVAMLWLKSIIISNNQDIAQAASSISGTALKSGLKDNIKRHVEDMSSFLDEKLLEIESVTQLISARATDFMTNSQNYKARTIEFIKDGDEVGGDWSAYAYLTKSADRQNAMAETAMAANIGDIFKLIGIISVDITSGFIAGENGYFIAARSERTHYDNYNPKERQWYQAAKTSGTITWSEMYSGVSGPSITCAAPYYGSQNGQRVLKGVAGATIALRSFRNILREAVTDKNATVFLLTASGEKLFSSDGTGARINSEGVIETENLTKSTNPALRELARKMTSRESGDMELVVDGKQLLAAYHPLSKLNWSLCVTTNEYVVNSPVETLSNDIAVIAGRTDFGVDRAIIVMIALLALMLLVIISYRILSLFSLARRVTKPISEFICQAEKISTGNFLDQIQVDSKSLEMVQLAASFNDMSSRIREYVKDIAKTTAEWQKMTSELDIAAHIQKATLPSVPLPPPKNNEEGLLEIDAAMFPAKEVGGDLYDYFFVGGSGSPRFAIVAGDVSGKGVSAAMLMLITKTLIKTHIMDGLSVEAAMNKLNSHVCSGNHPGMFVTLWVGIYDTVTCEIEYINAGHTMPLVKAGTGQGFEYIKTNTHDIVIGVADGFKYHPQKLKLNTGAALFLYTDGVTEAFNNSNEMFGDERLKAFLNAHGGAPLKKLLPALRNEIKTFADGAEQSDDITMLALRVY